jgi:AcrR family transcriptional regulator
VSSSNDLTARARIRDAAMTLFAERGIGATTVRDIAQAAGVSSGLLRHHFGSKEGLRDACDEWAMSELTSIGLTFTDSGMLDRVDPSVMRLQRFLLRSMMDGSPAALSMFDRMIDYGERWLATTELEVSDPRAYLAVLSAMKSSTFLMRDQISHVLGQSVDEPAGWARVLTASVEIFSQPLVRPEQAEEVRKMLARIVLDVETSGSSLYGRPGSGTGAAAARSDESTPEEQP